jgi:RimJ/RimL family protein N-acetyltransferase
MLVRMTIGDRIEGQLVALAPLRAADAPEWYRWLTDPETTRYLYGRRARPRTPPGVDELSDWAHRTLADPQRLAVGLEARPHGAVIGNARLVPMNRGRARYSILIGEAEHRGRGLGTEATRLLCAYGFDRLGLREIILDVDPRNAAGVAAYRRAGFAHGKGDSMYLRR